MATAKKLPSGSWRVRVYSHTDSSGKKHYESFTASSKQQVEQLARKYENRKLRYGTDDTTIGEALERYITLKSTNLSPSTIRGYRALQRNYFDDIKDIKVQKITNRMIQDYVLNVSKRVSAKTVKNIMGLLVPSITLICPDMVFNVELPKRTQTIKYAPSDKQIMELYENSPYWMQKCIAIAAFGGLRRGEIASLKFGDIFDNYVFVHSDMVLDENNVWVYKDIPKTSKSIRYAPLPKEVLQMLGTGEHDTYVIGHTPNAITNGFKRACHKTGIDIRFHDLRHYYASIGAVMGIPDIVLADFAGWTHNSQIIKNTYQNSIPAVAQGYALDFMSHFSDMLTEYKQKDDTKYDTKK